GFGRVESERSFVRRGNARGCCQIQSCNVRARVSEKGGEEVEPLHVSYSHRKRPEDEALYDVVLRGMEEEHESVAEREREQEHQRFENRTGGVEVEERLVPGGHDGVRDEQRRAEQKPGPAQVRLKRVLHRRPPRRSLWL